LSYGCNEVKLFVKTKEGSQKYPVQDEAKILGGGHHVKSLGNQIKVKGNKHTLSKALKNACCGICSFSSIDHKTVLSHFQLAASAIPLTFLVLHISNNLNISYFHTKDCEPCP